MVEELLVFKRENAQKWKRQDCHSKSAARKCEMSLQKWRLHSEEMQISKQKKWRLHTVKKCRLQSRRNADCKLQRFKGFLSIPTPVFVHTCLDSFHGVACSGHHTKLYTYHVKIIWNHNFFGGEGEYLKFRLPWLVEWCVLYISLFTQMNKKLVLTINFQLLWSPENKIYVS